MRNRSCHQCGHALSGRIDKKFCDAYCRSQFHNDQPSKRNTIIKEVDSLLKRNYRILVRLCDSEDITIRKEVLSKLGFKFDYITQVVKRNHQTYHLCYDRVVEHLDDEILRITKVKSP